MVVTTLSAMISAAVRGSGKEPLPIYTAVRHEIPEIEPDSAKDVSSVSEEAKEKAQREAWFQWFEITPYEFFCEEFSAGIPTWALGRKFKDGVDVPAEQGFHLPEIRMPLTPAGMSCNSSIITTSSRRG